MNSIIEEFYDFESNFIDWIDRGEKYAEFNEQISERFTKLEEALTEEQKTIIKELTILIHRMRGEAEKATYKEGFKTGLSLAIEAAKGNNT